MDGEHQAGWHVRCLRPEDTAVDSSPGDTRTVELKCTVLGLCQQGLVEDDHLKYE